MSKHPIIFIAGFLLGGFSALVIRTATHPPFAGHADHQTHVEHADPMPGMNMSPDASIGHPDHNGTPLPTPPAVAPDSAPHEAPAISPAAGHEHHHGDEPQEHEHAAPGTAP